MGLPLNGNATKLIVACASPLAVASPTQLPARFFHSTMLATAPDGDEPEA